MHTSTAPNDKAMRSQLRLALVLLFVGLRTAAAQNVYWQL